MYMPKLNVHNWYYIIFSYEFHKSQFKWFKISVKDSIQAILNQKY